MPIQGFETPQLVRAQIVALERELTQLWTESHGEAVRAQLALFTAELARMEAEGIEDEPDDNNPDDNNPALGTLAWMG